MEKLKRDFEIEGHLTKKYLNNLDHDFVQECCNRYEVEHTDEPHSRPTAITNLLGFCYWKLKRYDDARKMFDKTLHIDDRNLNALLNLACFYQKRYGKDDERVGQYITKLYDISNAKDFHVCRARYFFEHGTAMTCVDEFNTRKGEKGRDDAIARFEKAFEVAQDDIDDNEKNEWKFGLAFLYYRMDTSYGKDSTAYFEKGVKLFYEIARNSSCWNPENGDEAAKERHSDRIAKAWMFLSNLLSRYPEKRKNLRLEDVIGKDIVEEHRQLDQLGCCEKAEKLSSGIPSILLGLAKSYMNMKNMQKAKTCLDNAFELQPNIAYTLVLLGRWHLKSYELRDKKEPEQLEKALDYLEKAKEKRATLFSFYTDLARAYIEDGKFHDAIEVCADCYQLCPNGKREPRLQRLWGEAKDKAGDKIGAEKCYKQAEDMENGLDVEKTKDYGAVYYDGDEELVRTLVEKIDEKFRVDSYLYARDKSPWENESTQWRDMVDKCKRLLVFVSQGFVSKTSWAKQVVECELEIPVIMIKLEKFEGRLPLKLCNKPEILNDESPSFWSEMRKVFEAAE